LQFIFRLDSFAKVPSSIKISNVSLNYLDPTKPGSIEKITDVPLDTPGTTLKTSTGKPFGNIDVVGGGSISNTTQPKVHVLVNGSRSPSDVKINAPIVVSWSVEGKADACEAYGAFSPLAQGDGTWGKGNYSKLPISGSVTLKANLSDLTYQVSCYANAGQQNFVSDIDSVSIKAK
jgi:hypothetical protein